MPSVGCVDSNAQVFIAALRDSDQAGFAAGRDLAWYQSEPSREITPTREGLGVADGGHQSGRVQHADAGDRREPARVGVVARACGELVVERGDSSIEREPLGAHIVDQLAHAWAERGIAVTVEHCRQVLLQFASSMRRGAAALQQNGAHLVDQCRAFTHQPVAGAVQRLHVELLFTLDLDEAHRRPGGRLDDRLRVPVVVLLRLDVWAHIFG